MDGVPLQNDLTDEVKEMVSQQSKDVFDLWASKYEQQVLEEQVRASLISVFLF